MYNNPYMINGYNQQPNIDRINAQINDLEKLKEQIQKPIQPTNLTQNFQLAPTKETIKYVNSISDVQKDTIMGDTPYFSRDLSILWIKNTKGEIKTYELTEIVPKDEKDIQIELLQAQIDELKKGIMVNEQYFTDDTATEIKSDTSRSDETIGTTTQKSKSSSISRVSTSKTK